MLLAGHGGGDRRPERVRVGELGEAEGTPKRLGHRVPGDPLAVREAAATEDLGAGAGATRGGCIGGEAGEELLDEATLARAGRPEDGEQLAGPVRSDPAEGALEERRLALPADHRGIEAAGAHRTERGDPDDPVQRDRLGLAPQRQRLERLSDDGVADEAPGRFRDEDGAWLGRRLEPGCGVHRVADQRGAVAGDEDLTGRDSDSAGERER